MQQKKVVYHYSLFILLLHRAHTREATINAPKSVVLSQKHELEDHVSQSVGLHAHS